MAKETVLHNEPAFARPATDFSSGDLGLTKREYFAAAAMQGLCANAARVGPSPESLAAQAAQIADALIDCLNENPKL